MEEGILLRLISLLGLGILVGMAWLISENRSGVRWRIVGWGIVLQIILGMIVLRSGAGRWFFEGVKSGFDLITECSEAGAQFVFGSVTNVFQLDHAMVLGSDLRFSEAAPFTFSAMLAFKALPVIIFVSALSFILQHLGIIQVVVRGIAWLMQRTMKTSGAETFTAALQIFLGIESVSAISGYIKAMTRSEMFTVMVTFLASIAASVMVIYAGFGAQPGHLLAASLMSAPAALAIAKLMVPEMGVPQTAGNVSVKVPRETHNIFDAAAQGASMGLSMALNVAALLIVFIGLIHLLDLAVLKITHIPLVGLLGYLFRPFSLIMGVPWQDIRAVSELLATKTVFNEFLAYQNMQQLIAQQALSPRSITIATYALCGFANPGSIGIMIGGICALVPERRAEVAQLSFRAFIGGTLATFMTACVVGLFAG
ncbi:MAG TPA: nucleoside transporter C-terminal domain-containing protein [Candidatus Hydrogenedentes bacterium]|nr:nucleoside transporter C-terminal domain-containing protein [Candidatus Hydrogenedentota bacterium]